MNQFMHLAAFSKIQLNFHKLLQDMHLNIAVQELQEIFSLHKHEIPFIM